MAVILGVAIAISLLLLPVSMFPGLASEFAFLAALSAPFWLPAGCFFCWVFADSSREVADKLGPPRPRPRWLAPAAIVLVANCGLLWCAAPRRLAFLHAQTSFETLVATAAPSASRAEPLDRRLGVYVVDRFGTDPRGGIFFQTRSTHDAFHATTLSYGFVRRPNPSGTPFGDEQYVITHVAGDWYSYQASSH
jgi:hypothetical protein